MIITKLYELSYDTYSYHGDGDTEMPDSDYFDLEGGEVLGIYSSYEIALQKKECFSKDYYTSNLKRLNIYSIILDYAEWKDGFITLDESQEIKK